MMDGWMGDQEGQDGPSFEKKLLIAENRRTSTHKSQRTFDQLKTSEPPGRHSGAGIPPVVGRQGEPTMLATESAHYSPTPPPPLLSVGWGLVGRCSRAEQGGGVVVKPPPPQPSPPLLVCLPAHSSAPGVLDRPRRCLPRHGHQHAWPRSPPTESAAHMMAAWSGPDPRARGREGG